MQLALLCRELADNKKAENLMILDLRQLHGVADFMVLCTGTSDPHLRAVEEEISRKLRDEHQVRPRAIDGTRHSGWIVLDYVDVLVHVMKELPERYDLKAETTCRRLAAPRKKPRKKATAKKTAKKVAAKGGEGREARRSKAKSATASKAATRARAGSKARPSPRPTPGRGLPQGRSGALSGRVRNQRSRLWIARLPR